MPGPPLSLPAPSARLSHGLLAPTGAPTGTWPLRSCRRAWPTIAALTGSPWAACFSSCCGGEWALPGRQVGRDREELIPSPGRCLGEGGYSCLGVRAAPSLALDEDHCRSLPRFPHSYPLTLCFLPRHSPFRQHKTKDKHEIDRMTLTMVSVGRLGGVHGGRSPWGWGLLCVSGSWILGSHQITTNLGHSSLLWPPAPEASHPCVVRTNVPVGANEEAGPCLSLCRGPGPILGPCQCPLLPAGCGAARLLLPRAPFLAGGAAAEGCQPETGLPGSRVSARDQGQLSQALPPRPWVLGHAARLA